VRIMDSVTAGFTAEYADELSAEVMASIGTIPEFLPYHFL